MEFLLSSLVGMKMAEKDCGCTFSMGYGFPTSTRRPLSLPKLVGRLLATWNKNLSSTRKRLIENLSAMGLKIKSFSNKQANKRREGKIYV